MKDKVVLITGASGGLGSYMALTLAKEGAKVLCHYYHHKEACLALVEEIEKESGQAMACYADARDEQSIETCVKQGLEHFGGIDILINNMGISKDGMAWKMKKEDWEDTLSVNLTGPFLFAKCVLPSMRKEGFGRVINISSVVGEMGIIGTSAYTASKAGMIGLTKTLAKEVITKGITINCLTLGYFEAGMFLALPPQIQELITESIPMKRLGKPEEVVHAILFLCHKNASYITGEILRINGGIYI